MIYGIVSDIHGNLEALRAVLDRIGKVDRLLCAGDVVGYGPDPEECFSLTRSLRAATVLGNHDAAVCGKMDLGWFNPDARAAAVWTRSMLSESSLQQLSLLPAALSFDEFVMVHGSLSAPMDFNYVFSASAARPCFDEMGDCSLCFIGHTHMSEVYVQECGTLSVDQIAFTDGGKLDLVPGFRYIVNFGSVGQPRDGNPQASCGIYDSGAQTIEVVRVRYDVFAVQKRMREMDLPEFLVKRLEFGA